MPIKPRLQAWLTELEQHKESRRKTLDNVAVKLDEFTDDTYGPASEVAKMLLKETKMRDEELLGLLTVLVHLSGYIDDLQAAMASLEKRMRELGVAESKLREVEKLAKRHDEVYQTIDRIVKQRMEIADKETAYVQ
jgi:proteasome assembly chaperone (PAC2) family protein